MNNEEYWNERAEQRLLMGEKTADELMQTMKPVYNNCLKQINKEIESFYGRYAQNNNLTLSEVHKRLNPSELKSTKEEIETYYRKIDKLARNKDGVVDVELLRKYKDELRLQSAKAYMSRLEELKLHLKNITVNLGIEESKAYHQTLSKIYSDNYQKTRYELDKFLGFSTGFEQLNYKKLNSAIHQRWLGMNFSDRIWNNKGKLLEQINTTFLQGIAQGHNPKKIAQTMSKNMQTSYYNCERLCRTESAHIMGQATLQGYKDRKTKQYQFIATLDKRTSEICQSLDGKIFNVKDIEEGANYPPMHPNCRSTTVPYFEPDEIDAMFDEGTRVARNDDGELYYVPASMNYKQWQETISKKPTMSVGEVVDAYKDKNELEDRFGKEFSDFIYESNEFWNNYEVKELSDVEVSTIFNNNKWEELQLNKTISEKRTFIKNYIKGIDDYLNDKDTLMVRHNDLSVLLNNFDNFKKDPRLKTQFETGTSEGMLDTDLRIQWERNLSPKSMSLYKDDKNQKLRPVYGEMIKRQDLDKSTADDYGDSIFIFNKEKMKNRTSYTMGNSSRQQMPFQQSFSRALSKPENHDDVSRNIRRASAIFNYDSNGKFVRNYNYFEYVECQCWGGVDLSKGDVTEIIIPRKYESSRNFKEFTELMKSYNVKISFQ